MTVSVRQWGKCKYGLVCITCLNAELAKRDARLKRLQRDQAESEKEWLDVIYALIDAIGGPRGESIPEDVEHAIAEVGRLRAAEIPAPDEETVKAARQAAREGRGGTIDDMEVMKREKWRLQGIIANLVAELKCGDERQRRMAREAEKVVENGRLSGGR